MGPPALLPIQRKVCCGFLSPLQIHRLGGVWTRNLWVQWQAHYHYTTKATLFSHGRDVSYTHIKTVADGTMCKYSVDWRISHLALNGLITRGFQASLFSHFVLEYIHIQCTDMNITDLITKKVDIFSYTHIKRIHKIKIYKNHHLWHRGFWHKLYIKLKISTWF
jgi:hypothetical protein